MPRPEAARGWLCGGGCGLRSAPIQRTTPLRRSAPVRASSRPSDGVRSGHAGFGSRRVRPYADVMTDAHARRAIEAVWRDESARIVAALTRHTGDFAWAEDLAQDALLEA